MKSTLKNIIKEEIRKVLKEGTKIVDDKALIKKSLSNKKISDNCTFILKGRDIVALAYGGSVHDRTNKLQIFVKNKMKEEPTGANGYEFVEYEDGEENSFES